MGVLAGNIELLAGIFAGISDGILVTDAEGYYLDANPAATELLGYSRDELLKMHVADLIAADPQEIEAEFAHYLQEGSWSGEYDLKTKSGVLVPTEIRAKVIVLPKHTLYVSIIRDVTERIKLQTALREQTEINETVYRLGGMISAELDLKKLIQSVTDACTELTGASFGSFFYNVTDKRGKSYMLYTLSGVPPEAFAHFPMPRATDLFGPTFRGEGVIRIADVKEDPRYGKNSPYYGMPKGHLPVTSYLAVPVISRSGETLGGLFFGHTEKGMFTARHEQVIEGLAAQTAVAIDNARLYEAAERARSQAEESETYYRLLADTVPQMVWTGQADGSIDYVNRGWCEYTGQTLEVARGVGWSMVLHPEDHDKTLEVWQQSVETGEHYQMVYRLRRGSDGAFRWHIGRALPLLDESGRVSKWFGTSTDIDDQKRSEESIRFLSEASKLLSTSLDESDSNLKAIARLAVPNFADWCAVDILAEDGSVNRLAVEHVDTQKVAIAHEVHNRYPPAQSPTSALYIVLNTGKSMWASELPDALLEATIQDAELLRLLRSLGLKSYIMAPLVVRGKTLGAITFASAESGRRYNEEDLAFAEQLAQRVALALDNSRLYEATRQALQVREQALELHRSVEERLSLLVQASDRLIGSPTLGEVLPSTLSLSRELIAADAYAVWRLDRTQRRWQIVSSSGLSETFQHFVVALNGQTVTELSSPIISEDVYDEPLLAGRIDLHKLEGIQSLLAAPLNINGQLLGTISFYYHQKHKFSEMEIRVATALSNMAAAAIASAELYEEQTRLRADAEEANRIKDEFLATVSHELRTPLNAIVGWTQILRMKNYSPDAFPQAIEVIERNARLQAQIINDIMDVSRIITGKLRLEVQPVQLDSVIAAAIDTVRPATEAKDVRIQLILDSATPPVTGDANRLQQVIWNLLSNAVKFTPKGGRIQVHLARVKSSVEITISDSGIGISAEFLPYVFDRFRQADSSTSRQQGGLGLGLAIVRHLIEAHGGTVHVHSDGIDKGATFTLSLPVVAGLAKPLPSRAIANRVQIDGRSSTQTLPSLQGLRLLIVDDEADARDLLQTMLAPCGAEIITAATVADALIQLERQKPDLLVSDIGLPDEDGYTLIRKIRALKEDQGGKIPAIALTAYARSEDRVRALSLGYQLHVPKPVELEELAIAIASLSGRVGKSD
jgi:PAS domain S-box-containing protein